MAVPKEDSSSENCRPLSGSYYLARCVLRGGPVLQVVQGHIRSLTSSDIVFGKETSIELLIAREDGILESVCEQIVFGTIKDLAIIHWSETLKDACFLELRKDVLVVLSDSGKLSFLTYSNETHCPRFFAVKHIQLSSPGNLIHQLGRILVVDSNSCLIAVSAYESQLALLPVSLSGDNDIGFHSRFYDIGGVWRTNIPGTIWSMCFISRSFNNLGNEKNHILAVLVNRKGESLNEVLVMEWCVEEHLVSVISQFVEDGPLAHEIVEVPGSHGFALLFRLGDILLLDMRVVSSPKCVYRRCLDFLCSKVEGQKSAHDDDACIFDVAAGALLELGGGIGEGEAKFDDDPFHVVRVLEDPKPTCKYVCSWCWGPKGCESQRMRMIFCTSGGEFHSVDFDFDSGSLGVDVSDPIYRSLPSKGLLWLDGGSVISLPEMGDGIVLSFENRKLFFKSYIQNIAPIVDLSFVDCHKEKANQMYACCGVAPGGSLRVIRSGVSMEKLVTTTPVYHGVTNIFTLRMKVEDPHHSFLVITFVEETRVLSVGLSFSDVTDSVGFQSDVCSLACGVVDDGILVQIHRDAVRLCLPTVFAHGDGVSSSSPVCTTWVPYNRGISLGAVGYKVVVVASCNPTVLFILGIRSFSDSHSELYLTHQLQLQSELSCIFIPSDKRSGLVSAGLQGVISTDNSVIIGTHRPSVEVVSLLEGGSVKVVAVGLISSTNTVGNSLSSCVPQDVRVVLFDKFYIISGLRNGMVLRFEWPSSYTVGSSPHVLRLIAARRVGVTPVFLETLGDSLDSDLVLLSDRPWLLKTAASGLSYSSISFQKSTHMASISSADCPSGVLFVAKNRLHLVELNQSRRINAQKIDLMGTPRKVLYHTKSGLLLVMRTDLEGQSYSSDVCCIDPFKGVLISTFKFLHGESGKSMEIINVGNDQVILVGTSLTSGPPVMPSGESERSKGRIIVLSLENTQNSDRSLAASTKVCTERVVLSDFSGHMAYDILNTSHSGIFDDTCGGIKPERADLWQLQLRYSCPWPGMVLAVAPYLNRFFLASAGDSFYVCGFHNDRPQRVRKLAVAKTRFMITSLTSYLTQIAVGDCRDGVLFYSYSEDSRKLYQHYSDPQQRLVADCILMDVDTAVVSDRKCNIAALSRSNRLADSASPELNLAQHCSYYLGEIAMRMRKVSLSHNLPTDDDDDRIVDPLRKSVIASTLLGNVVVFTPVTREEHEVLEVVEKRLAIHPLTSPILGNDHQEFRSRECKGGRRGILDGDMLSQFLELTSKQQEEVLAVSLIPDSPTVSATLVAELLERIHHSLG